MNTKIVKGKVKSFTVDNLVVTKEASGERRISGWASKPVVDRGGDIVEVTAFAKAVGKWDTDPPIMLYMHDSRRPLGTWDRVKLTPEGLWVSGTMAPSGVKDADEAWILAKHKALRSLSIGFIELDGDMEDDGYHIKDLDLFEISPVSIPMNQEAHFEVGDGGKILGITLIEEKVNEEEAKKETEESVEVKPTTVIIIDDINDKKETNMFPDLTLATLACKLEEYSAIIDNSQVEINQLKQELAETKKIAEDVQLAFYKYIKAQIDKLAEQSGIKS
jgi:HK97 family phage prohead protease